VTMIIAMAPKTTAFISAPLWVKSPNVSLF
jgi:hypothetical protein